MPVSTQTLVQIAGLGGIVVATTGVYLKNKLIEKTQACEHYKLGMKTLRGHPGAVHYLGEPIKDRKFKMTDAENNACDEFKARFCVPVVGPKERGKYYFWAEKKDGVWHVVRAELELKSKPGERLIIVK